MPSLQCRWEGRCLDPETRTKLITYLRELAEYNKQCWEDPEVTRPMFMVLPREAAEERARQTELVREFDGPIRGRIVIEPRLATYEELQADANLPAQAVAGPADWPANSGDASCVAYSADQEQWLVLDPPAIELNGLDFRLYDPRALYPGEDRVSFLFVNCPQWPVLHGKIVAAENHDQCQSYHFEPIRAADWLLARPSIHLRCYLEEWFDLFLSWVKRYFVDDLWYWRGENLSQYEELKQKMDIVTEDLGEMGAKKEIFRSLLAKFRGEADQWSENVNSMALEGISLETMEVEREEVDSDSGIRCGMCGPSDAGEESAASRNQGLHSLYAQLFSKGNGQASEAVKQLVAEEHVLVVRALKDPELEHLRVDFLFELAKLGERALPVAKAVARCLDRRKESVAVANVAAYALSAMGEGAEPLIHAWMDETPAEAWESWPNLLFRQIGAEHSAEFLRVALTSNNGERKLWACKIIATEITHVWDSLTSTLVDLLPDADEWQRNAAIDALVGIGEPAIETMWAMTNARRADVRADGLIALTRYATHFPHYMRRIDGGGRDAFARLSARLDDPEPDVRVAAAIALQKVAVAISNERMRAELETANRDLQIAIAKGHQDCVVNRHGIGALRDAIRSRIAEPGKHPFASRRIAAVDLATSPEAHAEESSPLHSALHDWDDPHREEYLEAIRLAGTRAKGLMAGIARCTAASPPIQVAALKALAAMGDDVTEEAVDRTIICLESAYLEVRQAAANALGDFGPLLKRETTIALRKALIDDDRRIGSEACVALEKMKKLANDAVADIGVRVTRLGPVAINALAGIGTQNARQEVLRIYQRYADAAVADKDDDEYEWNVWIRDVSREWLLSWGMISSDQDDAT